MKRELGSFVFCDTEKCTGCKACELACYAAHEPELGKTVGTVTAPVAPRLYVRENGPVQCKHCEDSPCIYGCRRGAIRRYNGRVLIDYNKCAYCREEERTCYMACPFGSIVLMPEGKGVYASKCDLCIGRQELGPACVQACPNKALRLVDPEAEREEKNLRAAQALMYML